MRWCLALPPLLAAAEQGRAGETLEEKEWKCGPTALPPAPNADANASGNLVALHIQTSHPQGSHALLDCSREGSRIINGRGEACKAKAFST